MAFTTTVSASSGGEIPGKPLIGDGQAPKKISLEELPALINNSHGTPTTGIVQEEQLLKRPHRVEHAVKKTAKVVNNEIEEIKETAQALLQEVKSVRDGGSLDALDIEDNDEALEESVQNEIENDDVMTEEDMYVLESEFEKQTSTESEEDISESVQLDLDKERAIPILNEDLLFDYDFDDGTE